VKKKVCHSLFIRWKDITVRTKSAARIYFPIEVSHSTIQSQQIVVEFENKDPNIAGKVAFTPI
jgi:hypothetical protein